MKASEALRKVEPARRAWVKWLIADFASKGD